MTGKTSASTAARTMPTGSGKQERIAYQPGEGVLIRERTSDLRDRNNKREIEEKFEPVHRFFELVAGTKSNRSQ